MSDERPEAVVPLSRWRALLARSRNPRKRLELLLAEPQAAALVPLIPVEDFYYLVRGVGLEDAVEALRLASAEQVQGCLDLDLWQRDRLSTPRLLAWLEVLAELPPRALMTIVRAVDPELVSLVLARHTRVFDPSIGEAPDDDSPHIKYRTPDDTFVVEMVIGSATAARTLERFLDGLYRADPDVARSMLMDAKWSTVAELEEESYGWRTARLGDLGFPAYDDAIGVYQLVDPTAPTPARPDASAAPASPSLEPPMLPVPFADSLGEESFLGRVLLEIDDAALMTMLSTGIVAVLNLVLVADRVDPADVETVHEASARARDTLALGLEHLASGDVGRAKAILAATPPTYVFQVGYSLGAALGRRARALDLAGIDDPSLDALLEPRAMFPSALDPEPTAGVRPMRSVADLRAVEAFLAELESQRPPD
jgi:hypothetical protein